MVQKALVDRQLAAPLLLWLITRIPKWFTLIVMPVFLLFWRESQFTETFTGVPEANLSQLYFVITHQETTIRRKHGVFKILLNALRENF